MEQLWLRQCGDGLYALCCIPFRTYGLALDDVVSLSPDGSRVDRLVRASGRRVLRALLSEESRVADRLDSEIARLGLLREWSGDRHIAIDVPPGAGLAGVAQVLEAEVAASRAYGEWADVDAFMTS
jgi:hypothetical protein